MKLCSFNCGLGLLLLLFLSSCGIKPAVDPEWITSGSTDRFWVGVGQSNTQNTQDKDYRKTAEKRALASIASQIEVSISEVLIDIIEARNMEGSEYNKSITETRVESNLEFVDFADSYQTENTFYVLARLNKQKYFARLEKEMDEAKGIALDLISKSEQGPSIHALSNYVQAIKAISPYLDQFPEVSYQNRDQKLYPLLLRLFREYNDRFEIIVRPAKPSIKALIDENIPLSITVKDNRNNSPIADVPLDAGWVGKTESFRIVTNENGDATFLLDRHWATEKNQILLFQVNYDGFMISELEPLIDSSTPVKEVNVDVVGPKIFFTYEISNLGEKVTDSSLPAAVKKHFINNFSSEFVAKMNFADLELRLLVSTFEKSKRINEDYPYVIYANGQIEIINITTGEEILSNNIKSKGGDFNSKDIAGIRAIDNMVKKFSNNNLFSKK